MYHETVEIAVAVRLLFIHDSEFLLEILGQVLKRRAFKGIQLILKIPISVEEASVS